jgi:hypothetical protein
MQVVAEAVALGSTLDLPRDLLFEHWPRLLSSLRLISESWLIIVRDQDAPAAESVRAASWRAHVHQVCREKG